MTTEQKVIGGIGLVTVLILIGGVFFLSKSSSSPTVPKDQILAESGIHWHPKLIIKIKDVKQEIPPNIGIGAVHQKIHTHTQDAKDGVVHMEMQGIVTKEDTRLGNFFRIWGKSFNLKQIFDKKNGPEGTVTMTVNGKENKDFENYLMKDKDNIVIWYK